MDYVVDKLSHSSSHYQFSIGRLGAYRVLLVSIVEVITSASYDITRSRNFDMPVYISITILKLLVLIYLYM